MNFSLATHTAIITTTTNDNKQKEKNIKKNR